MSVQSEIDRISSGVANTYSVLEGMGATMPETYNIDNLAATASTVPTGGTSGTGLPEVTADDNGKHLEVVDGVWSVVEQSDSDESVIFEEQTISGFLNDDMLVLLDGIQIPIAAGETYTVVWDGIAYSSTAIEFDDQPGCIYLGNVELMIGGDDNGLPFIIATASPEITGSTYQSIMMDIYGEISMLDSHTVAIYQDGALSWNDLSGRPFGKVEGLKDILPVDVIGSFYLNSTYNLYICSDQLSESPFTQGVTYLIMWDGITYECVAQDSSSVVPDSVTVGNATAFGLSGNGEPFMIFWCNKSITFVSLTDTEAGCKHIVAIRTRATIIKQLDEKYIPDSVKLPEVTTNDNGKHLEVVNGAWSVVEQSGGGSGESESCLPEVTTEDEGKFLSVVNGAWSLVALTNGNEVAY